MSLPLPAVVIARMGAPGFLAVVCGLWWLRRRQKTARPRWRMALTDRGRRLLELWKKRAAGTLTDAEHTELRFLESLLDAKPAERRTA